MDLIKLKTLGRYEATLDKVTKSEPLKVGKVVFQLEPHPLDRKMIEKARTELNETAEVVTKALEEIRDLLKGEPELYVPDDDYFFAKFLRPCKWSAKPAFELPFELLGNNFRKTSKCMNVLIKKYGTWSYRNPD